MFARQPYFSRLTYPLLSHCNRISRKRVCKPSSHALQATRKLQQGTPKRPLYSRGSSRCSSRTGDKYTPSQKMKTKCQPLTFSLIHTTQKQLCEIPPSSLQRNTEGRIQIPPILTHSLSDTYATMIPRNPSI